MRASLVITSFNLGDYLPDALDSARDQTRPFEEIVVVDDGSTDDTRQVAEAFGVRVLRISNRGWASARNAGALATVGEAICFLDADDWLYPGYLEHALPEMDCDGCEDIGVVAVGLDADGVTVQGGYWPPPSNGDVASLPDRNCIWSSSLIRRAALVECGGFNHHAGPVCDWDLWVDITKRGWKVAAVDLALYHWRDRPDGMHQSIDWAAAATVLRRNHPEVFA